MEETKNTAQITLKELKNRFDFEESIADIKLGNDELAAVAEDDCKAEQVKNILLGELVKRNVPIKNIHFSESERALGGTARQYGDSISGIGEENAKKINAAIENSGIKVRSQIQEDKIRVTEKDRGNL